MMDVFAQPVAVERCTLQPRISATNILHSEAWHELHYVVHGRGRLEWESGGAELAAGDAIYHLAGTPHRMAIVGGGFVLQYVVWFAVRDPRWQRAFVRRWPPLQVRACGTAHRREFHRWQEDLAAGGTWRRRAVAAGFCAWLYAQVADDREAVAIPPAVAAMRELVQERCLDPPASAELAAVAGCSPHHANRLFARHLGVPPRRYATDLRMRLAVELLGDQGARIKDIAARLGYPDPYHFSRVFRTWAGCSPSQWRERGQ